MNIIKESSVAVCTVVAAFALLAANASTNAVAEPAGMPAASPVQEHAPAVSAGTTVAQATPAAKSAAQKSQNKGNGLAIAVVAPEVRGGSDADAWIGQFVQDSLTANFVRYTKMRVIDRANEDFVKAEQRRSESFYYSDDNALEIGRMTRAKLVAFGTAQKIGADWELGIRVNDIETNEIKAVATGRFSAVDVESGRAVNAVTADVLGALGIDLTAGEQAALSRDGGVEARSVQSLAKGAAAEKAGDTVSALAFYAETGGAQKAEAEASSARLLDGTIPTGSIKEKVEFFKAQEAKWTQTFAHLRTYLERELPLFVYDFSTVSDRVNTGMKNVSITLEPGVKVVPRRTAVIVWKEVMEAWEKICADKENSIWTQQLRQKMSLNSGSTYPSSKMKFAYDVVASLYNDDGSRIESMGSVKTLVLWLSYGNDPRGYNVKSQQKYFAEARYEQIRFGVVYLDDITGDLAPRIDAVEKYNGGNGEQAVLESPVIMTADEWAEFSKGL